MNITKEYEQRRFNEWLNYRRDNPYLTDLKTVFDYVYDRAYIPGKQENDVEDNSLWSRLTDNEKCEIRRRYHTDKCVIYDHKKRTGDKAQTRAVTRMKLLENLFGKDNINPPCETRSCN